MDGIEPEKLLRECQAHLDAGETAEALPKARHALRLAEERHDPRLIVEALIVQAEAQYRLGNYPLSADLARIAVENALENSRSSRDDSLEYWMGALSRCCSLLGVCAAETDDLPAAEIYLRRAIDLSRQANDVPLLAKSLHSISAGIYMPCGQYELALTMDKEALELARSANLAEIPQTPLVTISWVYFLTGRYEQSQQYLHELSAVVKRGTLADGWCYCIQGCLDQKEGRIRSAVENFRRTLSIGEKNGSPELCFYSRWGLASAYRSEKRFAAALDWVISAAETAARIGYHHLMGVAGIECGRCAWLNGDLAAAETYLTAAIDLLTPMQARLEIVQAHLIRAALYLKEDHPDATPAVRKALELIRSSNYYFLLNQERQHVYPLLAAGLNHPDQDTVELAGALIKQMQREPVPPLRIKLLGGLQVWLGTRLLSSKGLNQRRAGDLLVLLLTSPQRKLALETAAEQLSPERTSDKALDILRQATSALRRLFEPDLPARFPSRYLRVDDGIVELLSPSDYEFAKLVDFAAFEKACGSRAWEAALDLYGGDLYAGARNDDWLIPTRRHYSVLYQQALLEGADLRYRSGDYAACLERARKLILIEPWQEQAVLLGMRAGVGLGDLATARRLYLDLKNTLQNDLGVSPQLELLDYFRSLDR